MMTAYLTSEEYFTHDGKNVYERRYELDDSKSFKVNGKTVKSYQIGLCYDPENNNCCLRVLHVDKGVSKYSVVACETFNPLNYTQDEIDELMLKELVSKRMNIVNNVEQEKFDLSWD